MTTITEPRSLDADPGAEFGLTGGGGGGGSPAPCSGTTLGHLAAQHATGVLLGAAGTVYLSDGLVVHAESPAAPPLDVLLTAHGRLTPEAWQDAVDNAGLRHHVGRYLVDHGRLSAGELEICHLGALYDAAYFALAPDAGPVRFRPGAAHWLGPIRPVPADTVARETRRRRALLDHVCPDARLDTAPVCRRATEPGAVPPYSARLRALLDAADGSRTPSAIAHRLGRPAYSVLLDVRRLAAAGLVDPPARTLPTRTPPADDGSPPLPVRASAGVPGGGAFSVHPPDVELLRRLRDALEARL